MAGLSVQVTNPGDAPFGPRGAHGTISDLSSAQALTPAAGADRILLQAQGQNVRYTLDGSTPTASLGFQLFAGDTATIQVGAGMTIQVIQEAAGASVAYQWGS